MGSRLETSSNATRKRIESHEFTDEDGEEYGDSNFGGFGDYFRRKKIKLQNLDAEIRSSSSNNPPIFKGVVAHVNGYTQPSLNDLHRIIVSHGGGFLQYLDGKTTATHIIASALTPKKKQEFRKYRIVRPAWIVESVKEGRLLPWESFRLLDEGPSQQRLAFDSSGRISATLHNQSHTYRSETESNWYSLQLKDINQPRESDVSPGLPLDRPKSDTFDDYFDDSGVNEAVDTKRPSLETPVPVSGLARDHTGLNAPYHGVSKPPEHKTPLIGPDVVRESSSTRIPRPNNESPLTSEEHNARLLDDPHMRKSSAINPDFIQQYYRESRLHHLSTWKAELKTQLQKIAQERISANLKPKIHRPDQRRYILHVDFDSFFAAVSLKKHPELVDTPVAIAHGTGPGSEIASCNYPARNFGVKNGMWMKEAQVLCPGLKVLPYDFPAYEDASRKFYDAILDIDGIVQSVSIDEALIDITSICTAAGEHQWQHESSDLRLKEQEKADEIANNLRISVKQKTGCNVSVGIGGNILQAKLALRKAKPAGQFQLKPEHVLDFVGEFKVQDLPGVAYNLGNKLEELGVKCVKDIRRFTKEKLTTFLGPKTGAKMWEYARGIDNAVVGEQVIRKSVSAEINWGIRFMNQTQAEEFVQSLCDELHRRLLENGVKGKQLTMRIMRRSMDSPLDTKKHLGHGKCDLFNKSVVLGVATSASEVISKEAISILRSFKFSPGDLRGLGVQMTKLVPLKTHSGGELDNSQRQLQFKASSPVRKIPEKSPEKSPENRDPDEIVTPKKGDASHKPIFGSPRFGLSLNDPSQKLLDTSGTQFILPSQASPGVVAELPKDIRAKLVPKTRPSISEQLRASSASARPNNSTFPSTALPPESELDRETLDALPEDVREEILTYYKQNAKTPHVFASPKRPSPSKIRVKKVTTPTKQRKGRGRGRPSAPKSKIGPSLIQSNFIVGQPSSSRLGSNALGSLAAHDTVDEISPDFLAALPEDIRQEVLEEHKRARLKRRGGLTLPITFDRVKSRYKKAVSKRPYEPRVVRLKPVPPRPTFTSKKLSSIPELREMLGEWHSEFEVEGPYPEDVDSLTAYLRRVIVDERDIAKAVDITNWLRWLIDDNHIVEHETEPNTFSDEKHKSALAWRNALVKIEEDVSTAAIERGLPSVKFT
ncbi:deoxycytidyl transferase [Myotisia sp. PD_48]|nr:deoxycytidyl transferase [Myotisia sp. PD_48]